MYTDADLSYSDKLDNAVCLWAGKEWEDTRTADYVAFATFIGFPNRENEGDFIVDHRKPEIRRIIDMITGPHGKTILKVLAVQAERNETTQPRRMETYLE